MQRLLIHGAGFVSKMFLVQREIVLSGGDHLITLKGWLVGGLQSCQAVPAIERCCKSTHVPVQGVCSHIAAAAALPSTSQIQFLALTEKLDKFVS